VNIALAVAAAMAEETARFLQASFNETHLSTAADVGGDTLDRWAYDRYLLTRQEAQSAVVTLQITRTNIATGIAIEAGSLFGTVGGTNFSTINDVVFAVNQAGPLTVQAVAVETGTSGNVAAGTVVSIVSQLDDDTLSVTNPQPAAGGSAEEATDAYEARARAFFSTARRGTRDAVETGGTSVPGVSQAVAIETLDVDANPAFRGQLIIADASGQANAALASKVLLNLEEYRGLGVPVQVVPGAPRYIEIVLEGLLFKAGANTTDVIDEVRGAIVAVVNTLAPGETLHVAKLYSAIQGVSGVIVPKAAIVEPAGDLVPESGEVLRTTISRVTVNA